MASDRSRNVHQEAGMAAHEITTEADSGTVPVACTLTPADLAAQRARWEQHVAEAMTERAETADGLRLTFRREPGTAEELRRLAAMENECCSWAGWTVTEHAGKLVLEVISTGEGIAALHVMFSTLQPAPADQTGLPLELQDRNDHGLSPVRDRRDGRRDIGGIDRV
jgi:hypothetical protein